MDFHVKAQKQLVVINSKNAHIKKAPKGEHFFILLVSLSGRKRHLGYWVTKVVFIVLPQMICCPILFDTPFLYCPIRAI